MIEGKLKNGFEIRIEDEASNDFEILEDFAAIDENRDNIGKIISIFKRLLGEGQYKALKEHMRDKQSGRIRASEMIDTLEEILELNDETKNS